MADKSIGDLNIAPGTIDDSNTLFVCQQAGAAYKLDGHTFVLALTSILDGHGGISSISYTAPTPPSLTGTMTITLADQSTTTVNIQNGKGISSIAKTGTSGLVDTYTITYNDGTSGTFQVTNGAKGDTGAAWYVWIKYAGSRPTQDADMGTVPDDWMGIYSGTSSTAPTHYTDYDWFEIKGEKGDPGDSSTITSQSVTYLDSTSGTIVPTGNWSATVPQVAPGSFLWTKTEINFNDNTTVTSYSVSRFGIDGSGSVASVNNVSPDGNGNIALTASNIPTTDSTSVQSHITSIESSISGIPQPATANPIVDGTAAVGSSSKFAREDHVHPSDTAKQNKITSVGLLKGSGSSVSAATLGTDYTKINKATLTIGYNWSGAGPYTQTITISGASITSKTKVDLQPDASAIAQLVSDKVNALFVVNNSGTLTLYAVGAATTQNITVQVTYYETV